MNPNSAVFLSAGVPDPEAPHFITEGDSAAIAAAVSSLLYVTLGRRKLVWGGHPSITPMVWAFSEAMEIDYGAWVTLYQSLRFEDEFPEETQRFKNVVFTERVGDAIPPNLLIMRTRMLEETQFGAAVFIGGMRGIIDEYRLFVERAPDAVIVPVSSAGGAARVLARDIPSDPALETDLDYVELFHKRLGINPAEGRFKTPELQPSNPSARIIHPGSRSL